MPSWFSNKMLLSSEMSLLAEYVQRFHVRSIDISHHLEYFPVDYIQYLPIVEHLGRAEKARLLSFILTAFKGGAYYGGLLIWNACIIVSRARLYRTRVQLITFFTYS